MEAKRLRLYPGDKVQVIEDTFDNDDVWDALVATSGSVGTILSFEEYRDLVEKKHAEESGTIYAKHLLHVEQVMERCEQYPVRFERVVPPAAAVREYWEEKSGQLFMLCNEGETQILPISILVKIL